MRYFIAILICVIFPARTEAQATLPRHDAVASIGWAGSDARLTDYDRWRSSLFLGVGGGHYWTDHLKTEAELGWHSTGNGEIYKDIVIEALRGPVRSTYRISEARIAVGQLYQFGHNNWVHPYVGAGADIIGRRVALDRPAQTSYAYNPSAIRDPRFNVAIPALRSSETNVLVRPFLKAGAKMYASDRTFFVTELKLGLDPDIDHVLWKLGVGIDF